MASGVPFTDTRSSSLAASDEAILAKLGYKQEFVREFTNLSVRCPLRLQSPTGPLGGGKEKKKQSLRRSPASSIMYTAADS